MATTIQNKIPKQRIGSHSEIEFQKKYKSINDAREAFARAKINLLNVNNWHNLAGLFSGRFILTDRHGQKVMGNAAKDLYFKINIPVPGMTGSDGFDWVKVEEVYEGHEENSEYLIIRVRPSNDPESYDHETTHFFTHEARSNFCIERKGKIVKASVYGTNERPNIHVTNWFNRIRNWIVGKFATIGFNVPQWKGLVRGIILK